LPALRAQGLIIRAQRSATVLANPVNCTGIILADKPPA